MAAQSRRQLTRLFLPGRRRAFVTIAVCLFAVGIIIWILNILGIISGPWSQILLAVFVVSGVVFTFLQWAVPLDSGESTLPMSDISDTEFKEALIAIYEGIQQALIIENKGFRKVMLDQCNIFRAKVAEWKDGQFLASGPEYNEVLLTLYEHADKSVFCTSIPDYLSTWDGPLGRQIMEAHTKSRKPVVRVFLFNNRKEVTPEAVKIMKQQSDYTRLSITVLVYFKDEDPAFPRDISRDFTIIDDGEALGTTVTFGENIAAFWYFHDQDRKQRYLRLSESLKNRSQHFKEFYDWWENNHGAN